MPGSVENLSGILPELQPCLDFDPYAELVLDNRGAVRPEEFLIGGLWFVHLAWRRVPRPCSDV